MESAQEGYAIRRNDVKPWIRMGTGSGCRFIAISANDFGLTFRLAKSKGKVAIFRRNVKSNGGNCEIGCICDRKWRTIENQSLSHLTFKFKKKMKSEFDF